MKLKWEKTYLVLHPFVGITQIRFNGCILSLIFIKHPVQIDVSKYTKNYYNE